MDTNGYLSKEEATAPQDMPHDDVTVANGKVRVRGLSRREVLRMQHLKAQGIIKTEEQWEQHFLSAALVIPEMTKEDVADWQATPAAQLNDVILKVEELSGMREGAQKRDLSAVRE